MSPPLRIFLAIQDAGGMGRPLEIMQSTSGDIHPLARFISIGPAVSAQRRPKMVLNSFSSAPWAMLISYSLSHHNAHDTNDLTRIEHFALFRLDGLPDAPIDSVGLVERS